MSDKAGAMERLIQSVVTGEKLRTATNAELADLMREHVWAGLMMCSAVADLVGEVVDRLRGLKTCDSCRGWGHVAHVQCATCDGTGDVDPRARETGGAVREAAEAWREAQDGRLNVPLRLASAMYRLSALSSPPRPDFIRCALPRGECCHQRIPPVLPLEAPECNDGDDCCRYCGRGLQPCGACKPPAPPADAATEAVEDESPFAVADSIEEGRALEHCSPTDLPAATYLKGLVYRLVGAFDRVEMRRRALWDSHGKLLIQQKVAQKLRPRPSAEWHEDFGEALWFVLPIREAPYCGSPLADDWPFGEDGDDEGATWPALAEDQTLVWVPVEPIARLVEALSTPAPAPSAKEGRT